MPYALTVAGISFVMFMIAGVVQKFVTSFGLGVAICLPVGIILTVGTLYVIKLITKKKSA